MAESNSDLAQALSRLGEDPLRKVYPLMDGAAFKDLPTALANAGVAHRTLFLNIKDKELIRSGPWLIDPYHAPNPQLDVWGGIKTLSESEKTRVPVSLSELVATHGADSDYHVQGGSVDPGAQLEKIAGLVGDKPAAVFWIGSEKLGEAAMWRHLRGLNNVLIPTGYGGEPTSPDGQDLSGSAHEAVMFRHGDGNVLAEVLPVLDEAQFSRLFGPASAMVFLAPDHPGSKGSLLRRALLPDPALPAAPGPLKLTLEQMRGIEEARLERSNRRIMRYLRKVAPEQTDAFDDAALLRQTAGFIDEARQQGVRSEASLGKYCYLQSVTGGRAGSQSGVREYFAAKDGVSMDDKVALLLKSVILAAKQKEKA